MVRLKLINGGKSGLDPSVLSEIMSKSSGGNWSLDKYNPYPGVMIESPASKDYQGGFLNKLMIKDLNLAKELAQDSKLKRLWEILPENFMTN